MSNLRVVGYCRVSTQEQGNNGGGLTAQRDAIERMAASRGWQPVAVMEDVGVSGAIYPPSEVHMKRSQTLPPRVMTSGTSAVATVDSPIVGGARKWAMTGWATTRERWRRTAAYAITMLSVSVLLSAMSPRALAADADPLCDPSRPAIVYRPDAAPQFGRGRTTLVPCPDA